MSPNTVIGGLTGTQETVADVMVMMVTTTSFLGNKNRMSSGPKRLAGCANPCKATLLLSLLISFHAPQLIVG